MTEHQCNLQVLLCTSSNDRPAAKKISQLLVKEDGIVPWLIEEGAYQRTFKNQDINAKILKTDVVIVLLSENTVSNEGYKEKEFYIQLAKAQDKDEGSLLIIPVRLDDCVPPPCFQSWHWLNYFEKGAHSKLLEGLHSFADKLDIKLSPPSLKAVSVTSSAMKREDFNLCHFIEIPNDPIETVDYTFWVSQYPVTTAQYERFLSYSDYSGKLFWENFRKYDHNCEYIGEWGNEGTKWLLSMRDIFTAMPLRMSRVQPHHWKHPDLTLVKPNEFIRGVSWYEANAYCNWLTECWREIPEFVEYSGLDTALNLWFRVPLDVEWFAAAKFCQTKSPRDYPDGRSPQDVMYVPFYLKEWLANYRIEDYARLNSMAMCLGEMYVDKYIADLARLSYRYSSSPGSQEKHFGFRVVAFVV